VTSQQYRLGLALANLALLAGIAAVGARMLRPPPRPAASALPDAFDPTPFEIQAQTRGPNPLEAYRVVAAQFDRPEPKIVAPVVDTGPPPPPPPIVVAQKYTLVAAAYDPNDPARSSAILKDRGQKNHTIFVGSSFEGYHVRKILVRGSGAERVAVVTLDLRGNEHTVELKRQPPQ